MYEMVNGFRVIKQLEIKIKVRGKNIEQINISEVARTLGVHVTPALEWKT